MTEQEQVEKEEETEEAEEETEEETKEKKIKINPRNQIDPTSYRRKPVTDKDTKIRQKIVKLRGEGKTWNQIGEATGLHFYKAQKIYEEEMALGTVYSKRAANHFKQYIDSMEQRYGEIVETVDRLHKMSKKIIDEFESDDVSDMKNQLKFMKLAPTILQITREIKDQISFLREEQEKIKVEQKNFIYSPTQINNHLNSTLTYLHKQGYIKVLKKLPFDK